MIAFWVVALLAIAGALVVVLHRNPVYSALGLVLTLFQVAVIFALLEAPLLALLQVIVYAGAIVVLFLFVIMLLALEPEKRLAAPFPVAVAGLVLAGLLGFALAAASTVPLAGAGQGALPAGFGSPESLAASLFGAHLLPFELTSVLLLVAVVGAVVLARRRS